MDSSVCHNISDNIGLVNPISGYYMDSFMPVGANVVAQIFESHQLNARNRSNYVLRKVQAKALRLPGACPLPQGSRFQVGEAGAPVLPPGGPVRRQDRPCSLSVPPARRTLLDALANGVGGLPKGIRRRLSRNAAHFGHRLRSRKESETQVNRFDCCAASGVETVDRRAMDEISFRVPFATHQFVSRLIQRVPRSRTTGAKGGNPSRRMGPAQTVMLSVVLQHPKP